MSPRKNATHSGQLRVARLVTARAMTRETYMDYMRAGREVELFALRHLSMTLNSTVLLSALF